ncbi:MAG: PilZ domain-containing protein [Lachnospiraceae bacterium]|nr:PilZ domain-containing protein [Lachnospiraceae bacterium]
MYISEIKRGASVHLLIKNKAGASVVLQTTALEGNRTGQNHVLVVNCVKHDGKLVNFEGFAVTADINLPNDDRTVKYLISNIGVLKRNGQTYHVLYSRDNASPKDRRDAVRVDLDEAANIKIGDRAPITVRTKDVSISGIAFLIPGSVTVKENEPVEATFGCTALNATYKVSATVARTEKQPDGRILIGCRLSTFNKSIVALVTYLARKQGIVIKLS